MTRRLLLVVLTALSPVLAACTGSDDPRPEPPRASTSAPDPAVRASVALGDSYVSGPGLTPVDPDSAECARSEANYAHVLAGRLRIESLTDASCAGATTRELIAEQLGSVDPAADLVTVGIGANDNNVFSGFFSACAEVAGGGVEPCRDLVEDRLPGLLAEVTANVAAALTAVREVAPDATILLVGYPRVLPPAGTCRVLGLSQAALDIVRPGEDLLEQSLATAAAQAGVAFVSMHDRSSGHDVCAGGEAWVNGLSASGGDGVALHPNALGMEAVAAAIEETLSRP